MTVRTVFTQAILLLFVLTARISYAQDQRLSFNFVPGSNGITLGKINSIAKDKFGFLWLSDQTNRCIVRYDGNHMKRYSYSPGKSNTLGGYYPECLAVDSSGVIWIGFYGQGLDRFDPLTNTFTHYSHDDADPGSLIHNVVSAVLVDHLGNVWVGTDNGLDLLDQKTGKFTHFQSDPSDPLSLSHNMVRAIYEDRKGELWVGTGMAFVPEKEGGLNHYNRDTGTFTRYMHDPANSNTLIDNRVRSIFEDSYGNFWIGTSGDGLHKMDRATGTFERLTHDPANPQKLSRPPVTSTFDHITFITEDAERKLWIGTLTNGVTRYDPETKKVERFGSTSDQSGDYKENTSWCVYPTPDGHIWLSIQESKLFRIDLYNPFFQFSPREARILSYFEERPFVTWIGTATGLIYEDKIKRIRKVFKHDPSNKNSLSSDIVNTIYKDASGIFWFGTSNGLNRYDAAVGKFKAYYLDPNDSSGLSNSVLKIYEDSNRNLWVGTSDLGAVLWDRAASKFILRTDGRFDVSEIVETNQRYIWLGLEQGIIRVDKTTPEPAFFLNGLDIQSLYIDAMQVLWAGTNNGLYRYDPGKEDFIKTQVEVSIEDIISDSLSNLWMTSTNLGLIRLNVADGHLIAYGRENNIYPENMTGSFFYKTHDERIGICSSRILSGYYEFSPDQVRINQDTSLLYFTSLTVNGVESVSGKSPVLTQGKFTFAYDQNIFALRFTEIDFRNDNDARIYYRLENYDTDWRQSFAEEAINYFKVPPGDYTFRIKAANGSNGRWVEKSIAISITPPWWQSWWAYISYGLIFILGVVIVDRVQHKRILLKERALTRERELAQAKEMEKAYTELKATQSQLIQSEKMASLGQLTAGIAHEIQNPLNFVNNFSEVNTELIEEADHEIDKGNISEVKAILKNIKNNEEKISEHGKRADGIVKGMLQHSRTSSGAKEPTDINALADEYLRLAFHGFRAKDKSFNVTTKTDFDPAVGRVAVVPQDIGRVVLNLITNAFYSVTEKKKQSNAEYEPIVTLLTKREDNYVLISVKDNGTGISQNVLDKIFQPFFTTKPTGQGTGLGLSLSYDIVKAHGGELKVETKEGQGSEFIVSIMS